VAKAKPSRRRSNGVQRTGEARGDEGQGKASRSRGQEGKKNGQARMSVPIDLDRRARARLRPDAAGRAESRRADVRLRRLLDVPRGTSLRPSRAWRTSSASASTRHQTFRLARAGGCRRAIGAMMEGNHRVASSCAPVATRSDGAAARDGARAGVPGAKCDACRPNADRIKADEDDPRAVAARRFARRSTRASAGAGRRRAR